MFPFQQNQLYAMHPHPHSHHHHHHHHQHHSPQSHHQQQAMLAQQQQQQQQQQQANLLYYQYNQLRSMQGAFSNPTLPTITYDPNQNPYHGEQLVPSPVPLIHSPVQQQQNSYGRRSSPNKRLSVPSPDGKLLQNPEVFRPIIRAISNSILNPSQNTSPSAMVPTDSPHSARRHHSKQRQRLHSGSSCYESDSPDQSPDEDDVQWRSRKANPVRTMALPSNKRSHSLGQSDPFINDLKVNDFYQTSINPNALVPLINHHSSTKNQLVLVRPKLIQYIEENIIGRDQIIQGPWGPRRMIYCDYTASGRALHFIENYIRNHVLPLYGNTHSETSLCAQQSTRFREEARQIIKKTVNATDDDILLFTGTGSTGAVHTLVDTFDLHNEKIRNNTVIMISAFEHHSNILPWKETGVEMVRIPTTQQGILDDTFLNEQLEHYSNLNKRIICSLNAASNITGILTDVDTISALVHSYGGLIFWDYATAAPYVKIDMNPSAIASKDAVFISTHKFLGGPGTPGILIAKKKLFSLKAPKACGGGTVNFVTRTCHEYNYNIEIREEGGTPDIIGCIRAGLVFQLKDSLDRQYIHAREEELVKRFYRRFRKHETLILLGSSTAERLPIFSFVIYVPGVCKYLHHNFICLLLNDLFGVQVRSGCACAGPYALDLLNVNDAKTDIYCMFMTEDTCTQADCNEEKIVRTMMMKPGFTRLNLPFFSTDDEIEYILNAIQFVATDGWKFLPLYTYNPVTASWSHRNGFQLAQSSLQEISYKSGKMHYMGHKKETLLSRGEKILSDPFRDAKLLASDALRRALTSIDYTLDPPLNVPEKYKHMVWFTLPLEIALMMVKQRETGEEKLCQLDSIPFIPDDAKERLTHSIKANESNNTMNETSSNRKKHHSTRQSSSSRLR